MVRRGAFNIRGGWDYSDGQKNTRFPMIKEIGWYRGNIGFL
jgi:hypothetical protein